MCLRAACIWYTIYILCIVYTQHESNKWLESIHNVSWLVYGAAQHRCLYISVHYVESHSHDHFTHSKLAHIVMIVATVAALIHSFTRSLWHTQCFRPSSLCVDVVVVLLFIVCVTFRFVHLMLISIERPRHQYMHTYLYISCCMS